MGFDNSEFSRAEFSWAEFERILSDSDKPAAADGRPGRPHTRYTQGWSRKRLEYRPPEALAEAAREPSAGGSGRPVAYAELHAHSNFSFLDGASDPEELAEAAAACGLEALALCDHDGLYGVVRFAEAAGALGLPTVFGAELSLGLDGPQNGIPDPEGSHLVVLARNPSGYGRICRTVSKAQLAGAQKGKPVYDLDLLSETQPGCPATRDDLFVLTGCRKGMVPMALESGGIEAATRALDSLVERFGHDNVAVELWDHSMPADSDRNEALAALAGRRRLPVVATNNVHYATVKHWRLATALAAVRARRSLDEIDGWLPPFPAAAMRSGAEQARRFVRYPGAVERAGEYGREFAFELGLVAPELPPYPVPEGHDEMSWLRELAERGAAERYGPRGAERVDGAWAQIDHELGLIEMLGFAGYFLIVWDIVEFCRRNGILCQGRGSAANSAVCFAIGITAADAVRLGLLFERFLSPERDGPPDIDLDIESGRREEVIQYVYERYGREHTAQVANVITYRARSAVRDMGKALGYSQGRLDAWSRQIDGWGSVANLMAEAGDGATHDIPFEVLELAAELEGAPRHLGIHSGGMVICDRPVIEVCPVEWARMPGRSVLQWDKDDCAATNLVKFDLLGLGMLSALHGTFDLIREHRGHDLDLASIPPEDPAVYDMLCAADTVGVFQVESRAQMGTLPRLRPRRFYDLVVEVALIRPGPIQGGSVHPYIRRRNGKEEVTYLHPLLEPALKKTLGVPLFQEQLMQMAIAAAGFSAAEADELRQAMSAKRSRERMQRLRQRLYDGMATNGITGDVADKIWDKLAAFANFGFPESHSVSFAYLVYASAWLKCHEPAAFCAALLNAQPMGFWSPQSLVADAKRHGVEVRGPDINLSAADATLEPVAADTVDGAGGDTVDGAVLGVRLGISSIREIGDDIAAEIHDERLTCGPYADLEDLARRIDLSAPQFEALATAGAFKSFGFDRRRALWEAGAAARITPSQLPQVVAPSRAPQLPGLSDAELMVADMWATGLSADAFPTEFMRPALDGRGVVKAGAIDEVEHGRRIWVGGIVTHRQRPSTAGGTTFLNLEDETGLVNVICSPGFWKRYRQVVRSAPALLVRGRLERSDGAHNVVADAAEALGLHAAPRSRDFR